MRVLSIISGVTLVSAVISSTACGANSNGGSGDGEGGSDSGGTGGSNGGTGLLSGTGGATAGTAGCGPCLRIACAPPVSILVMPEGASPIADLTVEVEGITVSCSPNGDPAVCQWNCFSFGSLATGHYVATISAPGFESQTIEFDMTNPTNCGCCGCGCGSSFQTSVTLSPTGAPVPGCCAALDTDPMNCGECGRICSPAICTAGECTSQ